MLDQLMIKNALATYLKLLRFKFINILQWRTELTIWILLDILPFTIMLFVWKAIFGDNIEIQQTSFSDVVLFYFLVIIIQGLTSVHFEEYRPTEIRMGRIDFFLVKPYSYLKELVVNDVAAKFLYVIIFAPIMILFHRFLLLFTSFSLPNLSLIHWLVFITLLFIAYLLQLLLSMLITLSAFWLEGASGLSHFKWLSISLLSGTLIPLPLMPEWLRTLTLALPFKVFYALPIFVIQDAALPTMADWLMVSLSVITLYMTVLFVWKKGVKHYASAGG